MLAYYQDRCSPLLVNIGSRGVTGVAALRRDEPLPAATFPTPMRAPAATPGGQSELWAAALLKAVWWDLRLASLLTHTCSFF